MNAFELAKQKVLENPKLLESGYYTFEAKGYEAITVYRDVNAPDKIAINYKRLTNDDIDVINKVETKIKLNEFKPRFYQLPIFDAIENKGYRQVLAIHPRRSGKDIMAFNLCIRALLRKVCVIYYIFPTYAQGKKALWDNITIDGKRILSYIPDKLIESLNSQEMKIRFTNGSLLQVVGSDNYDCFDETTEILTEDGWKKFKDLNEDDKVATLDNGYLTYEKPLRRVSYDYNGFMYAAHNSSIDFMVTPNHRFYVKSSKGVFKFKRIDDLTIKHDLIPSKSLWNGIKQDTFTFPPVTNTWITGKGRQVIKEYNRTMPMKDFLALLGIFLAEGSTFKNHKVYRVTITQRKTAIRNEIRELLMRLSLNFVEYNNGFSFEDRQLYEYFSQFGLQDQRFIPKYIKNLSTEYLSILFSWLIKGDGYHCDTYIGYYSTSKKLIDDVQEIIIKLGYSGNVGIKKQSTSFINARPIYARKDLYEVRIRTSDYKRFSSSKKNYITTVWYTGKVYCVSVPSGIIKVRRNGKEMWSGNSLMGTNPAGIVFSEYALQNPTAYQYLRPILVANGGWSLFISTPRGKNHLYMMYEVARRSKDWFQTKLSIDYTQHIPLSVILKEKEEGLISDDLIQQEYYCSFEMGIEGSWYAKYLDTMKLNGQIGMVPWESGFKVHTAWDLGMRDSTTIIFFQTIGQTIRIIDCYENSNYGLEHYAKILGEKPYVYGKHIAPHDIKVRELGTGVSRLEKARQLGIAFTVAPDLSILDGIEAVRSCLSKVWINEERCKPLIRSLENYRKEWDEKKQAYKGQVLHDWSSHFADAMRYLAISLPKTRDGLTPEELDKRYQEAVYGHNSNMPSVFRDDLPKY
jgi:hypothetical protein